MEASAPVWLAAARFPGLRASPLEHHDGLLLAHPPGGLEKAPAVLDAFQVENDRLRQFIDLERLHVILDRDHRLVSRTAEGADADPLVFGKAQELHPEVSRLGDERGGPGLRKDVRAAAEEGVVGVADPHRVGTEDQDARLPRLPDEFLLQAAPLGARFGKSGGDQEHVFDPLFLQLGNQIEDLRRRDGDDGQIDRPRNLAHRLERRPAGDFRALGVDEVDRPLEPARGHVAEEHVAPLAERPGGADEGDGAGIEELPDGDRVDRRTGRLRRGALAQDDEGVHRRRLSVRADQERVDVRLGHVRELQADPGEARQRADEPLPPRRLLAAERPEELARTEFVDHLSGLLFIDGRDAEDHVVQRLGEDAAEAEHDDRPELCVVEEAGDEFPAAGEHRLNQISLQIRPRGCGHRRRRLPDLAVILEIQPDESPLRLVRQFCPETLQDDGKSDRLRLRDGLLRRGRDRLRHDRNAELPENLLGLRLGQGGPSLRLRLPDQLRCIHDHLPRSRPFPARILSLFPIREERLVEMRRGRAEDEGLRLPEELFAVVAQLHVHEGLFRFVLDHRGVAAAALDRPEERPGDESGMFCQNLAGMVEPLPEGLLLPRLQRREIDHVDERPRLPGQSGVPDRTGRQRRLDHQKNQGLRRFVPDAHRRTLRDPEELPRPHPDALLPRGEDPLAADHLEGHRGVGRVDGDLLPRLQTDLADLQIRLLHERRDAAPLMAEHLPAFQIDNIHFFTSRGGDLFRLFSKTGRIMAHPFDLCQSAFYHDMICRNQDEMNLRD